MTSQKPNQAIPLFDRWRQVCRRIQRAKRVLLLLDFDGTLVPFQPRPEDVRLDEGTRALLQRLAWHPRVRLGFISGRPRGGLQRLVDVRGAEYWGLHGWESGDGRQLSASSRRRLLRVKAKLTSEVSGLPGVLLEDKGAGLALNYRGASRRGAVHARAALRSAMAGLRPPKGSCPQAGVNSSLRVLRGHQIREVLPPEVQGKGAVARRLADTSPEGTLIVYAGDDTTDEDAFASLRRGLTIRVGRGHSTRARFRLRSPREVRHFLERLAQCLARG